MTRQISLFICCLAAGLALFTRTSIAQNAGLTPASVADAKEAGDLLRHLYFDRDQDYGFAQAKQLTEQYPDDILVRAWAVLNALGASEHDQARAWADQMLDEEPEDPWARFAQAAALVWAGDDSVEALSASRSLVDAATPHRDFLWLHAEALLNHAGQEEAIEYIDAHVAEVDNPAELLALKGYALYGLARESENPAEIRERADETFAKAQEADSASFNAWWLHGIQLMGSNRVDAAVTALQRAAQLSNAASPHTRYWRAVQGRSDVSPEEKQAAIEHDISSLLAERANEPNVLLQVATVYGDLGLDEKKEALERRLLEDHPVTEAAEWVLVNRYRAFRDEHSESDIYEDADLRETYAGMLREFIDMPVHVENRLLGDAYRQLYYTVRHDSTTQPDDLLEIVNGMVEYEGINPHVTYAGGAITLAERTTYFRRAEELARDGVEIAKEKIEEQREGYETPGDYENAVNWYTSIMYDALGWVYFQEGRLEDAGTELLRAYGLFQESQENLYHLGQLYEERYRAYGAEEEAGSLPGTRLYPGDHDLGRAEGYYIKGLAVQRPGENPNEEALETLYQRRYGSLDGFEDYRAGIEEIDREQRRETILQERIADAEPVDPFDLSTLEGDSLSSEVLEGKTTVINFWGIWCGWCIIELPEYQELYERYVDESDVLILTINNDTNPDEVVAWMEENEYDFPVMLDRGYAADSGVRAYPTTWFIDPQGRVAFIKQGWSEELLEEFTWRIESLRAGE